MRRVCHDNFDLGEAAVSILISRFKNPDVVPEKGRVISRNLIEAELAAYIAGKRVIAEYKPDLVYLFNGRGSQQRALLRACEKQGVDYIV